MNLYGKDKDDNVVTLQEVLENNERNIEDEVDVKMKVKLLYEKMKDTLNQILSERTGQPLEKIQMDTERDNFMSSTEAKEYGLIDEVITNRP